MNTLIKVQSLLLALLVLGCEPTVVDTCGPDQQGPYQSVEVVSGEGTLQMPHALEVKVTSWEVAPASALTQAYYDEVRYREGTEEQELPNENVSVTFENDVLRVEHNALVGTDDEPFRFDLVFPDRRSFIDCSHGGQPDEYVLRFTVGFASSEEIDSVAVESFTAFGAI